MKVNKKILVYIVTVLVVLTMLSRTIHQLMLPKVGTATIMRTSLESVFEYDSIISYANIVDIKSNADWVLTDFSVNVGEHFDENRSIAMCDTTAYKLRQLEYKLELEKINNRIDQYTSDKNSMDLIKLNNQLNNELTNLVNLQHEIEIKQKLFDSSVISLSEFEKSKNMLNTIEIKINQLSDEIEYLNENTNKQLEIALLEKSILELKKALIFQGINKNGEFAAQESGVLVSRAPIGDITKGDVVYSYTSDLTSYSARFNVDLKENIYFFVDENVFVETTAKIEGEITKILFNGVISEISKSNDNVEYVIDFDSEQEYDLHSNPAEIRIMRISQVYNYVVPLNAIKRLNGEDVIFVLRKRNGVFGEEYYVQAVTIKIIDRNNTKVAIEGYLNYDDIIVSSTTKSLINRMEVKRSSVYEN